MREIFPESGPLDAHQAYGDLGLAAMAAAERPYVIANMVSSADGKATLAGKSGGISSEADRELFHELRTQVDAVMAGTTTIGTENYGPLIKDEQLRERRLALGLEPSPVAITVTRSLTLPMDAPLFQDPGSKVVVLTNSDAPAPACKAQLELIRTPGESVNLGAGFERLRKEHGVRTILLEGGPTLLGTIVAAGLLDELFLTISPLIAGAGSALTIVEAAGLAEPLALELKSALEAGGTLFLRYALGG